MPSRTVATLAAASIVAGGVALVFIHYYGGSPGAPGRRLAALGFGAPFIGVGFLALGGTLRSRHAVVFAAAMALIPMSLLSVVLFPLVIPAVVVMIRAADTGVGGWDLALAALLASALAGSLAVLVFHQDPATWSTPMGSAGSSNIITTSEAALAITVAVTVNLIAVLSPVGLSRGAKRQNPGQRSEVPPSRRTVQPFNRRADRSDGHLPRACRLAVIPPR